MCRRILWLDNDRVFIRPHLRRLLALGYRVMQVMTASDAVKELEESEFDLLIIDVMLPVREEDESLVPPGETDSGRQTGLVFYRNWYQNYRGRKPPILIFTIREDDQIFSDFVDAGLAENKFMTKAAGADGSDFAEKVRRIIEEHRDRREGTE